MTLDPELVAQAKDAAGRLAEAERQALTSRGDYHTAIRRMHLAGGSLREIAQTMGLSHQRVQQIVRGAGGSWWTRVWRSRRIGPEAVCTWCGRPPAEVDKLIAGPHVYICDRCLAAAERTARARAASPFTHVEARGTAKCSFCRKRANAERPIVVAPKGHVCLDCLRVCREIADGRAA
jgi:hypothetical protein